MTVTLVFPGIARLDAGKVAVISVELTYVDDMVSPFRATVVFAVNPVPVSVTALAVLIGPALGDIEVNVGTGGLVMATLSAFETGVLAAGVSTVTVAVPTVVRSEAGTIANSSVPPKKVYSDVGRLTPFHCTTDVETKPVPKTFIVDAGAPARNELGATEVMTGVPGR